MRICLHERVLNGFIGFGGITQIVPGNPRGAPLLAGDDLGEQLARRMIVSGRGGMLNLCREDGFDLGRSCAFLTGRANSRDVIAPTHGYDSAGLSFTGGYGEVA
jgi:hypothetical protein